MDNQNVPVSARDSILVQINEIESELSKLISRLIPITKFNLDGTGNQNVETKGPINPSLLNRVQMIYDALIELNSRIQL